MTTQLLATRDQWGLWAIVALNFTIGYFLFRPTDKTDALHFLKVTAAATILGLIGSLVISALMAPSFLYALAQVGWLTASAFIAAEIFKR